MLIPFHKNIILFSECNRNPMTGQYMDEFIQSEKLYATTSDVEVSFEEAYDYCASIGSMAFVSEEQQMGLYYLNDVLSRKEHYWIGYKAIENTLYLLEKKSMNANRSEIFQHDFNEDITAIGEMFQNEKCIVGQAMEGSFHTKPEFSVKPCSSQFKVLCMRYCPSKHTLITHLSTLLKLV